MTVSFDLNRIFSFDVVISLALVIGLVVARKLTVQAIKRQTKLARHIQHRWASSARNLLLFIGIFGLVLIWAPQLQTFALSLTAIAAAVVLATKELILCLSGSFVQASSRAFKVGDWIEVNGIRGEVADMNLLTTTLQEFEDGPFAYAHNGRTVVVPNSLFLTSAVRNQSALREHSFHQFTLTHDPDADVFARRPQIESLIADVFEPYSDAAEEANGAARRRFGPDLGGTHPRIRLKTTDGGKHQIHVTLFCPPRAADEIEVEITHRIMALLAKKPAKKRAPPTTKAARTSNA